MFSHGDELCVYSPSQQRLRYIIRLDMNGKKPAPASLAKVCEESLYVSRSMAQTGSALDGIAGGEGDLEATMGFVGKKKEKEKVWMGVGVGAGVCFGDMFVCDCASILIDKPDD